MREQREWLNGSGIAEEVVEINNFRTAVFGFSGVGQRRNFWWCRRKFCCEVLLALVIWASTSLLRATKVGGTPTKYLVTTDREWFLVVGVVFLLHYSQIPKEVRGEGGGEVERAKLQEVSK